jgi:E3 ubiquitin-protein ligase synoviolin
LYNNITDDSFLQACSGDDFVSLRLALMEELPEDTVCHICIDPVTLEQIDHVRRLQCGHWFHAKCIMPWLFRKQSCPTCRKPVGAADW